MAINNKITFSSNQVSNVDHTIKTLMEAIQVMIKYGVTNASSIDLIEDDQGQSLDGILTIQDIIKLSLGSVDGESFVSSIDSIAIDGKTGKLKIKMKKGSSYSSNSAKAISVVLSKYLKEYDIAMPALLQQRRHTLEIAGKAGGVATKKTHGKQSGGVGNT